MKPGAGQGSPLRVAPGVPLGMGGDPEPCTEDTAVNNYICLGRRPGAPKWVPGWCGWRGGAGGVVQFFDKVVDVPVVALGTFVVDVQLLDKAADVPVAVPPRFRVLSWCQGRR